MNLVLGEMYSNYSGRDCLGDSKSKTMRREGEVEAPAQRLLRISSIVAPLTGGIPGH
jgi:hypothetical protein